MIFFTKRLYLGYQPNSDWRKRAHNEWQRNRRIYIGYAAVIAPLLPKSIVDLEYKRLHDADVTSVKQESDNLTIVLDARPALSRWRGKEVSLIFSGVKNKIKTSGLVGQCWIEQEVHLSSRARFSLQILFSRRIDETIEFEIEADSLKIKTKKYPKTRIPCVKAVKAGKDYQLKITFTNGEKGVYDCTQYIKAVSSFHELKDEEKFRSVKAAKDKVVWPSGQEIGQKTLYLGSVERKRRLNMGRKRSVTAQ